MFLHWLKIVILSVVLVMVAVAAYLVIPVDIQPARKIVWGTTFTKSYAEYLGLDWRQTYLAILDDLGLAAVRIGANWDEIEPERGKFVFDDYDWMFDQAEARGIEVVLAIGFKLPRWPECRAPEWAKNWLPSRPVLWKKLFDVGLGPHRAEFEQAQLAMMRAVVDHFKERKNIKVWQVENEGFIGWFGDCPPIPDSFVRREVDFVRVLDPTRPIVMTESGELSTGIKSAIVGDIIGTSLYREVWSMPLKKFITYPLPPSFYARKARLLSPWIDDFHISELQLEAWTQEGILNVAIEDQLERMSPEKMRAAIDFARRTGIDEIYAWGAEWWWWLKINGYPQLWETAREEFAR